jgi:hypothetical protein
MSEQPVLEPRTIAAETAPPDPIPPSGLQQPWVGLIGLVIVLAVFWLLGMSTGAEHSLLVLGPITTYGLPVLAMVALWWGVRPGSRRGRALGGVVNTVIVAAGALVLTVVGLAITGNASMAQVFGTAGPTDPSVPTFPFAIPLAAFVFVVFLQLTFVNRNWPFQTLQPVAGCRRACGSGDVLGRRTGRNALAGRLERLHRRQRHPGEGGRGDGSAEPRRSP